MTPIISALRDICREYPLKEKVLVTPDYRLGREVLSALSRSAAPWVNFTLATASSLAGEIAGDAMVSQGLKRVSGAGIMAIVEDVFSDLSDSGRLRYFEKHQTNSGIINALTGVIMELRTKGIQPSSISEKDLIKPEKAGDIRLIFSEYEKRLREKKLVDKAGLTSLAIENLGKTRPDQGREYVIFSRYYMSGLERRFMELVSKGRLHVVDDGQVVGIKPPKGYWENPNIAAGGSKNPLSMVFSPEKNTRKLPDSELELFSARSLSGEVREIFRRVVASGVRFDDTELIYTDYNEYVREIMFYSQKTGVPVTFSEGLPAAITSPFRAAAGFLKWIKHDFEYVYLARILSGGDLDLAAFGESPDDGAVLGDLLRSSGVGWSRERYHKVLGRHSKGGQAGTEKVFTEEEMELDEIRRIKARRMEALGKICSELLSIVPGRENEEAVLLSEVCSAVEVFLEKYSRRRTPLDRAFVEEASRRARAIGELGREKMTFSEAADRILGTFFTIKIGPSEPRPGHLHVSSYKHGGRSCRKNIFIAGLDETRFPGRRGEDPVLLDSERRKISSDLEISSDATKKNIYDMGSLLSGLEGKVTASFSVYSVREDSNIFPSSAALQLFRLKTASPEADYEELMRAVAGDTAGEGRGEAAEIDDTSRWIGKLSRKAVLKDGTEAVKNVYPWIARGIKAEAEREKDKFTEYDGNLGMSGDELDPRSPDGAVLSSTRLEKAAECPFKYFLLTILGVEKPKDFSKDPVSWLDAMNKGSLLHEVFENFTSEARTTGPLAENKENALAERKLLEAAAKYRDKIPPPNDMVYDAELLKLKRDVEIFLSINRKMGTSPLYEELAFGTGDRPPVEIPLEGGSRILLRGIIDRVDKAGEHEYHVWDYKTGSARKYERRKYLSGGEQLQHALYAVAAETVIKSSGQDDRPSVTRSGYILASEKGSSDGKGVVFYRDPGRKHIWQKALGTLLDIISMGGFIQAWDEQKCSFCEYFPVCFSRKADERWKSKKNAKSKVIELWEELKKYV